MDGFTYLIRLLGASCEMTYVHWWINRVNIIIIVKWEFLLPLKYVHGFITVEYYPRTRLCLYIGTKWGLNVETVNGNHIPDIV